MPLLRFSTLIGSVHISPLAEADIRRYSEDSDDGRETGGILLGHGPDHLGDVYVEVAGDAGPAATREPQRFVRDLEHAKRLADDAWRARQAVWVGEWHTHLHGDPHPSDVDLATYAHLLAATPLAFDRFVSVIVTAGPEGRWTAPLIHGWVLQIVSIREDGHGVLRPN